MLFWAGIIIALFFAWFTIKMGFYETWTLLFNLVISLYLAIFGGTAIGDSGLLSGLPFGKVIAVAAVGVGVFLILQFISFLFFTSQFNVTVPRIFDIVGAGFLGFWSGLLIWSFLILLLLATPILENNITTKIGEGESTRQACTSYISWWCGIIHGIAGSSENGQNPKDVILSFLDNRKPDSTKKSPDANKPPEQKEVQATKPVLKVIELPPEPDETSTQKKPADISETNKGMGGKKVQESNDISKPESKQEPNISEPAKKPEDSNKGVELPPEVDN